MNLKRKTEMQERRITALQEQIEKITKENEALRSKNQELSDKEAHYRVRIDMVDELRREFADSIAEMNTVKEQYQQLIYEARQMKKEYSKKFKPLIRQLKSFN